MLTRLDQLTRDRQSFGFETTLASRSFAPRIRRLLQSAYECHLVFLWLPSADLAVARVADRVRLGGHAVPEQTIRRRYRVVSPVVWKFGWRILPVGEVHDQPAAPGRRPPEERAMGKGISKSVAGHELEPVALSELIHRQVRVAIETAVHEELRTALGAVPYERSDARRGYRNGTKTRALTGPTGLVALTVPRATLFGGAGAKELTSAIVPRYQRRMPAHSTLCSRRRLCQRARCRVWWPR